MYSLNSIGSRGVILANGQEMQVGAYDITARVHGQSHDLVALELGENVLLGMSFLAESKVTLHVTDGGDVLIEKLEAL